MSKSVVYAEEEILKIIEQLVEVSRSRKSYLDIPVEFIKSHPWSLKYLSNFAEAYDFMLITKTTGVKVFEEIIKERIMKERKDQGLMRIKIFVVNVPEETELRTKEQCFMFEEQEAGQFICLNG